MKLTSCAIRMQTISDTKHFKYAVNCYIVEGILDLYLGLGKSLIK